jgi:hypothetical protein
MAASAEGIDIWYSDVDPEIDKPKLGGNVGTHLTAPERHRTQRRLSVRNSPGSLAARVRPVQAEAEPD